MGDRGFGIRREIIALEGTRHQICRQRGLVARYVIVEELAVFGAPVHTCSRNQKELDERLPESSPDVRLYSCNEFPQRDVAVASGVKTVLALPVFEPSSGERCVGVVELLKNIYVDSDAFPSPVAGDGGNKTVDEVWKEIVAGGGGGGDEGQSAHDEVGFSFTKSVSRGVATAPPPLELIIGDLA
ncbi:hypothetical protein RJ640_003218 [Escallonia rubra]|uniref:GAF domain-containing protein n=1 Tax=Escallonia rubra TaxID=112253 RepID=A0AA88UBE8_9ASTE|nr:hypothetical protein RJ640_003218 [Escallonia rubra]